MWIPEIKSSYFKMQTLREETCRKSKYFGVVLETERGQHYGDIDCRVDDCFVAHMECHVIISDLVIYLSWYSFHAPCTLLLLRALNSPNGYNGLDSAINPEARLAINSSQAWLTFDYKSD